MEETLRRIEQHLEGIYYNVEAISEVLLRATQAKELKITPEDSNVIKVEFNDI
jgi:hypothetical protein